MEYITTERSIECGMHKIERESILHKYSLNREKYLSQRELKFQDICLYMKKFYYTVKSKLASDDFINEGP